MAKVSDLTSQSIKALKLSKPVAEALSQVQAELADAYRESFLEMVRALNLQTSSLERIQRTLDILVRHLAPQLAGQLPPAIRIAPDGEEPDLASAIVVADPIAAGYTLSQVAMAEAIGLTSNDISSLCRIFKLADDDRYAVRVRLPRHGDSGKGGRRIINYHERAIPRLLELLAKPPQPLSSADKKAVERARRRLLVSNQRDSLSPAPKDGAS